MVCREIRRNSAGCLRLRDECEKCREILAVGEFGEVGGGTYFLIIFLGEGMRHKSLFLGGRAAGF